MDYILLFMMFVLFILLCGIYRRLRNQDRTLGVLNELRREIAEMKKHLPTATEKSAETKPPEPAAEQPKATAKKTRITYGDVRLHPEKKHVQSDFEKRSGEILCRIKNWICVGEEYRSKDVSPEYAVATTWLIRLGVLVLLAGLGFLTKYAIEHNTFPPELRVGGLFLLAAALVCGGLRFASGRYRTVALGVIGLGFAAGYFSIIAGSRIYDLFGRLNALCAMAVLTACFLVFSVRRNYFFPALVSVIGGYLAFPLLRLNSEPLFFQLSCYAVMSAGVLLCACFRSWHVLNWTGFLLNFGLFANLCWRPDRDNYRILLVFLGIYFVLFALLPAAQVLFRKSRLVLANLTLHEALHVFYFSCLRMNYQTFGKQALPALLPAVFALLMLIPARAAGKTERLWIPIHLIFAVGATVLFIPLQFSPYWIPACWAAAALISIALAVFLASKALFKTAYAQFILLAAWILFQNGSSELYTRLHYTDGLEQRLMTCGVLILALFAAAALFRYGKKRQPMICSYALPAMDKEFFCIGSVLLFLYSSFEIRELLTVRLPEFKYGGLSVWWGIWATALLLGGILKNNRPVRLIALALFILCAVKVFLLDLANLTALYRIGAFLGLGLLMLTGAVLYTRFKDRIFSGQQK